MGGADFFGGRGRPILVGVIFEKVSGIGSYGGLKLSGRIRRFCPVGVEGCGGLREEVLEVDADVGKVQGYRVVGGD